MDSGLYIAVFYLARPQHIRVGQLGRFHFGRGTYFYVGSARKNLHARIERHSRKRKCLRWHIDYLSVRAIMLGAVVIVRPDQTECRLAESLAETFARPVKGFGASDCRCAGHLFHTNDWL